MAEEFEYSLVHLNVGGKKFLTSIDTLTQREPASMLSTMFSRRHALRKVKGYVFIDRNGKYFGYILDWLRTGVVPTLKHNKYTNLLLEAEYFQLDGLTDGINAALNKDGADLTRTDIIKCIQSADFHGRPRENIKFRGVNLSGLDLSNLDLSGMDFSSAVLKRVCFLNSDLKGANFTSADAEGASFRGADFVGSPFKFPRATFAWANLSEADFTDANLERACLKAATLRHAKFTNTNLTFADLAGAFLQEGVDLRKANTLGAWFNGANFGWGPITTYEIPTLLVSRNLQH